MQYDLNPSLAARDVCLTLMKSGLISRAQKEEIISKMEIVKERLEKHQAEQHSGHLSEPRILTPFTIIDIITHLNLARKDDASSILDEEIIFQALANHWQVPFKKIDPLKMDLSLVTSIIPRSFAIKHLVLPIAIEDGLLTVATANPFNRVAMDDIAKASKMEVKSVFTPKSDLIKLINEFFGFKHSIAAAEHQLSGPCVDLSNLERYVRLTSADELPSNDQHIVN